MPELAQLCVLVPLALCLGLWHVKFRWKKMMLITVIDGDTFVGVDTKGTQRRLRLRAVDAPELSQRNGAEAKRFVQELTKKKWLYVRLRGRDRYRRHLADVRTPEGDLALKLVRAGYAYRLEGGLRIRLASLSATLLRKGVHQGFGQSKPWEAKRGRNWIQQMWHTRRKPRNRNP